METEKIPDNCLLRFQGDDPADKAFGWLKKNPQKASILNQIKSNRDLWMAASGYGKLSDLIRTLVIPQKTSWADPSKMKTGAAFFQQYAREILTLLGLYSLPYCYAGANGVRVLFLSRKLKEEPAKRLSQTARFVFEVCEHRAFSDEGKGLVSILKIRLQHSAARYYSRRIIRDEVAVNQEDMLGTMLAFSLIVIRGLRKTGIEVHEREADAYLHLWKVIGYLMGVKSVYLPDNIRQASVAERHIRKREFRHSKEAEELTLALIKHLSAQHGRIGGAVASNLMVYLLGKEVARCLGINKIPRFHTTAVETVVRIANSLRIFSETNHLPVSNLLKSKKSGKGEERYVL